MNTEKILEHALAIAELAKEDKERHSVKVDPLKQRTLAEYAPGDIFNAYGIEMLVLNVSEDGEEVFCITKELYKKDVEFGDSTKYQDSNAEKVVKEFEQYITDCFGKDSLVEKTTKIVTVDGQEVGSYTGKARLMTFDEARTYNRMIVNKDLPDWWWLMNPWSTPDRGWKYSMACVCPSGCINCNCYNDNCGVRPVCILKSSILIPQ
ncbi:MAG: hypothetical protein HFG29_10225 [Eubacterium sp.]|nr:hypothetical protein [Eubacterium sp.]